MNQIGIDLIGEINLLKDSSRKNPLLKEWWGIANLKGEERKDSYYIYLPKQDELNYGQTTKAEFKYKFSKDERFKIKLRKGQILELNEGSKKIGEFLIEEIINENLKY